MKTQSLNGKWELFYAVQGKYSIDDYADFSKYDISSVPCTVPGNVELDLSKAGLLPKDLFFGKNILEAEKCEGYEWWYRTSFSASDDYIYGDTELKFESVDCFGDYYLNGKLLGTSENALIPHSFDVSGLLLAENELIVHIRSAFLESFKYEKPQTISESSWQNKESRCIRKPPHCYGWDIMPRALSAGLWRGVSLILHDNAEIAGLFIYEREVNENMCHIVIDVDTTVNPEEFLDRNDRVKLTVKGVCRDSSFEKTIDMKYRNAVTEIWVSKPHLWWPYGYGSPDLYDFTITVSHGEKVLCEKKLRHGLRSVRLDRTDSTDGVNGKFRFIVNGVEIYCTGSNWVPLDAYHSRDAAKYEKALSLFHDCGCNMVRCWGGNVYEDDRFFELCDEYGIMVWQDFGMACNFYPQEALFYDAIREEATYLVRKLRNYASLVLWAGDNECDEGALANMARPSDNRITREILPEVIKYNDFSRPYLASSPYISDSVFDDSIKQGRSLSYTSPENHLWGPRDYFKAPFYTNAISCFVSETGYHGCPSEKSIRKIISPDKVFPYFNNDEWILHSSDQNGNDSRVMLMHKQVLQLFGEVPTDLENYSLASQISQAEAKKFFIERMRSKRPYTSGILWWNMLDGWPQMSDAVVDYFFEKKLAYGYIKTAQAPFSIMISEIEAWKVKVIASNCTRKTISGEYRVCDADDGKIYAEGKFGCRENSNIVLSSFPVMYSDKKLFLIKWKTDDGNTGKNHYLAGYPAFDFEKYKTDWLPKILEK